MKCVFCGKSAGLFRKEHPECRELADKGKKYLRECIDYIYQSRDCMNISEVIANATVKYNIPQDMIKTLFITCWNAKAREAFADGKITSDEVKILREMLQALKISKEERAASEPWKILITAGLKKIERLINSAISSNDFSTVAQQTRQIAQLYGFDETIIKRCVQTQIERFLDRAFEDGVLDEDEEGLIDKLIVVFELNETDIEPFLLRIIKGTILREVLAGITPDRICLVDHLPVLLQKNESAIWVCHDVQAYENKVYRHNIRGGSGGLSFRVAKGLYLRTGAFRGEPVERTETVCIGTGQLIITNKNVFWVSSAKSIKLPAKKIVSVVPYSDGIVIQKDGATAKPMAFLINDPWFVCNLISNLNLLQ